MMYDVWCMMINYELKPWDLIKVKLWIFKKFKIYRIMAEEEEEDHDHDHDNHDDDQEYEGA